MKNLNIFKKKAPIQAKASLQELSKKQMKTIFGGDGTIETSMNAIKNIR